MGDSTKHPMQRGMQERINLLLAQIEQSGGQGIEQKDLEMVFFINGYGTPPLVRKYLTLLVEFGKVNKEGTRFYVRNRSDPQQLRIDIHTHTHTNPEGLA